jgi:hypothetical protein
VFPEFPGVFPEFPGEPPEPGDGASIWAGVLAGVSTGAGVSAGVSTGAEVLPLLPFLDFNTRSRRFLMRSSLVTAVANKVKRRNVAVMRRMMILAV